MKTIEVAQKAIVLDDEEMRKLRDAIAYCRHRICKHPTTTTKKLEHFGLTERFLSYLLMNLPEKQKWNNPKK